MSFGRAGARDGVLLAYPGDERYGRDQLCPVAYLGTWHPDGRVDLAESPVDYDGTHLAGIRLDERSRRWLDHTPWDPLRQPHPFTGSLYFEDFVFVSETGWARELQADGLWGPAKRIDRALLKIHFPRAAEVLWPSTRDKGRDRARRCRALAAA